MTDLSIQGLLSLLAWSVSFARRLRRVPEQDRDDVLQEAWVILYADLHGPDVSVIEPRRFLARTMHRLAMSGGRVRGRKKRVEGWGTPLGNTQAPPPSCVEERQIAALIEDAPARLRPWLIAFTECDSDQVIARRLGVRQGTVRWWRATVIRWIVGPKEGSPASGALSG